MLEFKSECLIRVSEIFESMTMSRIAKCAASAVILITIARAALADDKSKASESKPDPSADQSRAASQEALGELNTLIGGWRGTGQPVRSSTKGSWTETAEWVWEIKKDHVSGIHYRVTGGKLLASAAPRHLGSREKELSPRVDAPRQIQARLYRQSGGQQADF